MMKHIKYSLRPKMLGISRIGHYQRGVTLIEWMVSITIGLILVAGMATLIAEQSSAQAELEKSSRQVENGRYAMHVLNEDIQLAGYYGEFSNIAGLTVPASLPDPCKTAVADLDPSTATPSAATPLAFPVQGYNDLTTLGLPSCIDAANHVDGTDILVLRRIEPAAIAIATAASAAGGQVYLQSGLTASGLEFVKKVGVGSDTSVFDLYKKDKTTLAPLRKVVVNIYFVSPCSVMSNGTTCSASDDSGKPIPTLKRLELSPSGNLTKFTTTPLVEGIENMQIDYGLDVVGSDGAPDGAFVASPALGEWPNVMALRVHLLARNNESSVGYLDTKTYSLGLAGTTTATNDRFKRRVFSQLIRVVNPSSRRDR